MRGLRRKWATCRAELDGAAYWKFSTGFPNGHRLFNYLPAREVNLGTTGQVILVEGVADALLRAAC